MRDRPLEHLPSRIGSILDDAVEEERVHDLWCGTRARMARAERTRAAMRGGAAVAALAACVVVAIALGSQRGSGEQAPADGALRLATGERPSPREVPKGAPAARVVLSEGSSVLLAPGTAWRPIENSAARFETELARGSASFDVTKGLGRRWVVRAGETAVEVLGTRFEVSRERDATRVTVERGVVRVTDARLEGGEVILRAGQSVVAGAVGVEAAEEASVTEEPSAARAVTTADEVRGATAGPSARRGTQVAARPVEPAAGPRPWESLARSGEHAEAYEAIGERFVDEAASASAERLLLLADVARLSGHPRDAVAPLERLLAEHPGDPRAPIAAVVLGRVEMDALGRRERARAAFERAVELGVPAALRADVDRRLSALRAAAPGGVRAEGAGGPGATIE